MKQYYRFKQSLTWWKFSCGEAHVCIDINGNKKKCLIIIISVNISNAIYNLLSGYSLKIRGRSPAELLCGPYAPSLFESFRSRWGSLNSGALSSMIRCQNHEQREKNEKSANSKSPPEKRIWRRGKSVVQYLAKSNKKQPTDIFQMFI